MLATVWGTTLLTWMGEGYGLTKGFTWLAFIVLSLLFNLLNLALSVGSIRETAPVTQQIISDEI